MFLPESFQQGCQNYFLRVQRNTYRATFMKESLQKLRIFGYFSKFSGEWRKTFFRVGKTAIDVRGNRLWENRFQKRKNLCFFPILSNFLLLAKKFRQIGETRNLCIMYRWMFLWKNIFEKFFYFFSNFSHFFGVWSNKSFVGNFLSGLSQLQSALLEALFGEKSVFFEKTIIVHLYWSLSISFVF